MNKTAARGRRARAFIGALHAAMKKPAAVRPGFWRSFGEYRIRGRFCYAESSILSRAARIIPLACKQQEKNRVTVAVLCG
jgi:hypothetical protein